MSELVGSIHYEVDLDTRKMVDGQRRASRELDGLSTKLTATAAAVGVLAATLLTLKIAKLADEILLLSSRVEVAAGNIESGAAAMSSLVDISRRTQSSLAGNIEVFTRLNQSILQMGGTQQDTLRLTELLAKAIKVSGASAVEAKSAMLQFGQALGSGKLAGDELRSLLETAPYLMQQLAAGIGVPVGALKKLGEEGKLTADVVTAALGKAAAKIDEDFRKFPQTIESAMVVAQDQAALAALKFDQLTGSSAALTGVIKGAGEILEELAKQFTDVNGEVDALGRNKAVSDWAEKTRVALSYVVDAADITWQTLQVLGRNTYFVLERIAAAGAAQIEGWKMLAKGDVAGYLQAYKDLRAEDEQRRKEVDAADAKTLSKRRLAGQQMRDSWKDAEGFGALGARAYQASNTDPAGKLRGGGGGDKGPKFDSEAYLGSLEAKTLEGLARIDAMEKEALRKNAELLKAGKITRAEAAKAANLIETQAAQDRLDIQLKNAEDIRSAMEAASKQELDALRKHEEDKRRAVAFASGVVAAGDPAEQVRLQYEAQLVALQDARAAELLTEQQFAAAVVANSEQMQLRLAEIAQQRVDAERAAQQTVLSMTSSAAGQLLSILKSTGKDRTALAKSLFLAQKAIAVAEILINTEVAAAKMVGVLGPFGIPMASMIRATGYASAAMVGGMAIGEVAGGRQYGGPTTAGQLYRVNETGQPEMFTAANGAQYMLPTTNGNVTPADQVGSGRGGWTINIHNAPPGTTAKVNEQQKVVDIAVARAEANFVDQVSNNRGSMWSALRGATNIGPRI